MDTLPEALHFLTMETAGRTTLLGTSNCASSGRHGIRSQQSDQYVVQPLQRRQPDTDMTQSVSLRGILG